jgi:hypothetical protein
MEAFPTRENNRRDWQSARHKRAKLPLWCNLGAVLIGINLQKEMSVRCNVIVLRSTIRQWIYSQINGWTLSEKPLHGSRRLDPLNQLIPLHSFTRRRRKAINLSTLAVSRSRNTKGDELSSRETRLEKLDMRHLRRRKWQRLKL